MKLKSASIRPQIIGAISLASMLVAGCRVGPTYVKPVVPAPPAFTEQHAETSTSHGSPQDWWTVFHDPVLNDLQTHTVNANLDMRIAVAQLDQADAFRRTVRAGEFPTIATQPSYGRTREAQGRPNNGNTGGAAATYNDLQLPIAFS